jgi:glutathione S-transferase
MQAYYGVAIVTLLASLVCFGMSAMVARTHAKTGILAPTMAGDPLLERTIRAHLNTLEWVPIFLPSMWLLAIYWSPLWATMLGGLWIIGRIIYFFGYRAAAARRFPGFFIQVCATFALLFGALGRIIYLMTTTS